MIILKGVENKKFIRFNKDYHFLRLQTFFKAIDWCSLSNRYHIPLSFFSRRRVCYVCINISQLITPEIPQTKFFFLQNLCS